MHIHGHSEFSPLDGKGTPKEICVRAKELGHDFVCLTDHGVVSGWWPLQKAAKEIGIKPGFGVEGYIDFKGIEGGEGNEGIPHITLVAKTPEGFGNLRVLVELASKTLRRGKPVFTIEQLEQHCKGLIVTTGCPTGIAHRLIVGNNLNGKLGPIRTNKAGIDNSREYCRRISAMRYRGATPVCEIVAQPGFIPSELCWEFIVEFAQELDMPYVLTSDYHFVRKEDFPSQDLLVRIATDNPYSDPTKKIPIPSYQFMCSEQGLLNRAIKMGMPQWVAQKGIDNAKELGASISDQIEIKKGSFPKFNTGNKTAGEMLRELCVRGVDSQERTDRLNYELEVIIRKNIADYFLILHEVVTYVKSQGHVVVCRGSAGGSLVAYSCGISETDPIPYGLLFERFYDEERTEPPDIDIDFSPTARKKAVDFLSERYNTAKILALSMLSRKQAIIDVARMVGIKRDEIESALSVCNDDLDEEHEESALPDEIKLIYDRYDKLRLAETLIGVPRQEGKHAAGLIISSEEIPVPVITDKSNERILTVDKRSIDALGIMKGDLLSVAALEVIERTLRKIGKTPEQLYKAPIKDVVLHHAVQYPAGIFQLDGAVLPIFRQIKNDNNLFKEFVAASALARPGAMKYVGKYAAKNIVGDSILDETYGVVVYQEQIMNLARRSGSLSPQKLRKAVSKSEATEVRNMIMEAGGLGLTGELLENVIAHGKYSFNKSHCLTYGLVGYWMSFLKKYYPCEFVESYLNVEVTSDNPNWSLIRRLIYEERKRLGDKFGFMLLNNGQELPFQYTNGFLSGGFLATGLKTRKFLSEVANNHTAKRNEDWTMATNISMSVLMKQSVNQKLLLSIFPWSPILEPRSTREPVPESHERKAFSAVGYMTSIRRIPQTKAMPYATVGFTFEDNENLIHGKISAKDYLKYKKVLDTEPGTPFFVEGRVDKTWSQIGWVENA